MIRLFLSILLIILILVFFWKALFSQPIITQPKITTQNKKVKFSNKIKEIPPTEKTQENFQSPTFAQPNNKNKNLEKLEKEYDQINPSNFYTQDYNTPNFTSDVMDLRKFYSYDNPPNDTTRQINLPKEPYNAIPRINNEPTEQIINQVNSDPTWLVPKKQTPSGLQYQSDYWTYKNEVPMNGGDFGGITGFDSLGEGYSLFYSKDANDIVQEQEALLKPNDDLRNGMGTPQKQEYNYNMSNP